MTGPTHARLLPIGEHADRVGVSVRALRYYEQQGLLTSTRTPGGQRRYPVDAVVRVGLLRQLLAAGLSSRTIAGLLPQLDAGISTPRSRDALRAERTRLDTEIAELQRTRERLQSVLETASHPNPHCPLVVGPVAEPTT